MFTSLFPTSFLVASHAVECGLTIPGLRYVVDSGWTEFVHTDVAAGMDVRTVAPVSQASMVQVRVCILNKCNFIVYSRRSLRHPCSTAVGHLSHFIPLLLFVCTASRACRSRMLRKVLSSLLRRLRVFGPTQARREYRQPGHCDAQAQYP